MSADSLGPSTLFDASTLALCGGLYLGLSCCPVPGLVGGGCRSLQSEPSDLAPLDWLYCQGPGRSVEGIKDEENRFRIG